MADQTDRGMPPLHDRGRRVSFDPTINLGHLLTMGALVGTVIMGWAQLSTRLEYVERQVATMATLMEKAIIADAKLGELERRIQRVEGDRP